MARQAVSSGLALYVYVLALAVGGMALAVGWDPVLLGAAWGAGVVVAMLANVLRRDVFAPPDRPPAYRVVLGTRLEDSRR